MIEIGKLERVPLREVWKHEAYDFTTWLESNVDVVNEVAAAHGVSGAQVSLAWLLQRPLVASVIIGGRSTAQFEDNLKSTELKLSAEDLGRLDAVSQPNLPYPYWHQNFTAQDRLSVPDLALHRPYLDK